MNAPTSHPVRDTGRDLSRAAVVLAAVLLLVVITGAVRSLDPRADAAPAGTLQVKSGPSFPLPGVDITSGGSADRFFLVAPQGAACSGDSASGGYRLNSFWAPVALSPELLTWDANGPVSPNPALTALPLFGQGNPFVDVNTTVNDGAVTNLTAFDFAIDGLTAAAVPPGDYNVGIACTTSTGSLDKYWKVVFTFATTPTDLPTGITWTVNPVDPGVPTTIATVPDTTPTTAPGPFYPRISGEGSSLAANSIDAARANVSQFGITVDYNPSGSTAGRKNYLLGTVDFAVSDVPFQFQPEDGSAPENPAPDSFAYAPVAASGVAFAYNLSIGGQRVTNLRLSGENVAKIFTGLITRWNDPAIQADNPGLVMPAVDLVPVVRSDGAGTSSLFTEWMIDRHSAIWTDFCVRSGRAPGCGTTSFYPTIPGMIAQAGDLGVAGYVSQSFAAGSIGFVSYSYALGVQLPVAKVLNAAGYYTEPTPLNVAVALVKARVNTDTANPSTYLTHELQGVFADTDPRSYPLSSYSYLIVPTKVGGPFSEGKGATLAAFVSYTMCRGQEQAASLGYAPLPMNVVQAGFEQIAKIPGALPQAVDFTTCINPTFSPDGRNILVEQAPQPLACDQIGTVTQCPNGTGGMANVPTNVSGGDTTSTTTSTTTTSTTTSTTTTSTTTTSTTTTSTTTTMPHSTTTVGGDRDDREDRDHLEKPTQRPKCTEASNRGRDKKCEKRDRRSSWFHRPVAAVVASR
jgi:phosphate ABC transporter phosphate-binding protein